MKFGTDRYGRYFTEGADEVGLEWCPHSLHRSKWRLLAINARLLPIFIAWWLSKLTGLRWDGEEYVGGTYTTGTGQVLHGVHSPDLCAGRPCVIHNPSDHHMVYWPTNFRSGGPFDIKGPHMERICPHGVGHPDPDDTAFHLSQGNDYGVHGCDGCCHG